MRHAVVTGNLAGTWNFKTIVLKRVSAKSIIHCLVGLFNKRVYPQNWDANWDATSEVLEGSCFSVEIQKNWHSGYSAFAKSFLRLMQCWEAFGSRTPFAAGFVVFLVDCFPGDVSFATLPPSATCFLCNKHSRCRVCRSHRSLRLSLI